MSEHQIVKEQGRAVEERGQRSKRSTGSDARGQLLYGLRVTERQCQVGGVSTTVLEGGDGAPVVLLHGPGGSAVHWWRVINDLVTTNCLVIPDLPGQGSSEVLGDPLDDEGVLEWLGELIERRCPSPPALVGYALGGAIAARFVCDREDRVGRLVLVDALGLCQFDPAPEFGLALDAFLAQPSERTHDQLWRQCALDLDGMRQSMGGSWDSFEAYNLDRARAPSAMAALELLMEQFGLPAIPAEKLARIAVPTTLIWGQHDLATPLQVAKAASVSYGWPLHVIESCADDPPIEQPHAFVTALRAALHAT
jgi:Predicted hydrolases or acyltransferases (alpha/beta hydrolase superfamily)